jgi:uncharacterized protein (TIGR03545 family)
MGWPKYLKKTYTKEELTKKVLKKVQLKHDREFLESLFHSEKKGAWTLKKDLTKTETARLKKIVKEIKKGKGGLKTLPVIIILVIVASLTIFSLIFKNPLAETYIEMSLANIFGATVEMDNLDLSLFNTRMKFDSLEITDESNLDTNLIELGYTEAFFDLEAILQKKVVIKSLQCQNIGWSTPRKKPGKLILLSSNDEKGKSSDKGVSSDGVLTFLEEHADPITANLSLAVQDPRAFVDDQWAQMETPKALVETKEKYESIIDSYPDRIDKLEGTSRELISRGDAFLKKDYNSYLTNPNEVPVLVKEAESYKNEVISATDLIQKEIKTLDELKETLEDDKNRLLKLKEDDLAHMTSLIAFPEGGVETIFKGMVQSYIASLLGDKYEKVMKIVDYAKKYRDSKGDTEDGGKQGRREGRIVQFETRTWPDFLLQEAFVSASGGDLSWETKLNDLAGDPDQWSEPVTLGFNVIKGDGSMAGEGLVDRRTEPESPSRGDLDFTGFDISTDALSSLGIPKTTGLGQGNSSLTVENDHWLSRTKLVVSQIEMKQNSQDQISRLVYRILSGKDWDMTITIEGKGDDVSFDLNWPLMSRIDDEIGVMLKEQAGEFLIQAQNELRSRFDNELAVIEKYSGDLDQYKGLLEGDLSSLDNQKAAVEDKIAGVQNMANQKLDEAKRLVEEEAARLKAETEAELEKAKAEVEAEAARLQAEAEAKAEEEKAKAEAAAAEEAKKLLEESSAGEALKKTGIGSLF